MKKIKLTQGQYALVDDHNHDWLMQWKWHAWWNEDIKSFYAKRTASWKGKQLTIYMHRLIMQPRKGEQVDHLNHKTLDNQERNMRNCTNRQNAENARRQSAHGPGVQKSKRHKTKPYHLQFRTEDGKLHYMGTYATAAEARAARAKYLEEKGLK